MGAAEKLDRFEQVSFCPQCFADDYEGSWGAGVLPGGHCINCGAGGAIPMPRWAVEQIRQSASWVGRRYYPGDEDREIEAERRALLATVTTFPGRVAEPARTLEGREWVLEPGHWTVKQYLTDGRSISTTVKADSADEAIEKTRYALRYVPEVSL